MVSPSLVSQFWGLGPPPAVPGPLPAAFSPATGQGKHIGRFLVSSAQGRAQLFTVLQKRIQCIKILFIEDLENSTLS